MGISLQSLVTGLRVRRQEESGEFPCPQCSVDRPYALLVEERARGFNWRAGNVVATYVECKTCGNSFPGELRDRTLFRDRDREQKLVERLRNRE